jgi:hypothetical protein
VGRLRKAREFWDQVDTVRALADEETLVATTVVSLCILAGIAAADAICCLTMGHHATGDNHAEAARLIRNVEPGGAAHARDLDVLLGLKTRAQYGADPPTLDATRRARRAAGRLVAAAGERAAATGG